MLYVMNNLPSKSLGYQPPKSPIWGTYFSFSPPNWGWGVEIPHLGGLGVKMGDSAGRKKEKRERKK
jgi:hypothetical protein